MKTIILLVCSVLISFNIMAGNAKGHGDKYCAKMKDGKKVVMYQGSSITVDVTLSDGSRIQPNGTIIKMDGTRAMLNEGSCISKDGKMVEEKNKKDRPK